VALVGPHPIPLLGRGRPRVFGVEEVGFREGLGHGESIASPPDGEHRVRVEATGSGEVGFGVEGC
jgi:hypothetical protein